MASTIKHVTLDVLKAIREEMRVRKTGETFLVFPMGSQFDHLIVQSLARLGVFALVADPATITKDDVLRLGPKGIVVSGGPSSVVDEPPPFDMGIFGLPIPKLGICLGAQMGAQYLGLSVAKAAKREFGKHTFTITHPSPLFEGFPDTFEVLENHGDRIESGSGIEVLGETENAEVAAWRTGSIWGVQFHPETHATFGGDRILANFCFGISGARDRFPAEDVAGKKIREIAKLINGKKVLVAFSGGTDSSITMWLIKRAIEDYDARAEVLALYIKGVDRPDDEAHVRKHFGNLPWCTLKVVDATDEILASLAGKITMRDKRLAFRPVYGIILIREALAFGANIAAQGTLYTDIVESGGGYQSGARKSTIKDHHNIGHDFAKYGVLELIPLSDCVKDTGRNIGQVVGVPEELLWRHPFPGPGKVIRIEGEVTREKLKIFDAADGIYISELREADLYPTVWQAGAVVTDIGRKREHGRNDDEHAEWMGANCLVDGVWCEVLTANGYRVGLHHVLAVGRLTESVHTCNKGEEGVSGHVAVLSAVRQGDDGRTQCLNIPYPVLRRASQRITNEERMAGAVVYSLSDTSALGWRDVGTVVALWAVWSTDGFTAEWAELPFAFLRRVAEKIMAAVPGVGAVVYRISDKPPATIEWG